MKSINCRGKLIDLQTPKVMGILNINSDSFYAASRLQYKEDLQKKVVEMDQNGATFFDIGATSSRPGAKLSKANDEIDSVVKAIQWILAILPEAIISVDTYHAEVADAALKEGASLINDISFGEIDPNMLLTVSKFDAPIIGMHMQGIPSNMQNNPTYDDIALDILDYFISKIEHCRHLGIKDIILDPGFGFGKTIVQNYELANKLEVFQILEKPILVGVSRKGMFWKLLESSPDEVLPASLVTQYVALQKGAKIIRTHDVKETSQTIRIFETFENHTSIS